MKVINTSYEALFPKCNVVHFNNEEEWHKLRGNGLGGSDIASVLGENKYKSKHQLWLEKTKRVKPAQLDSEAIETGNLMEPILVDQYYALYRKEIVKVVDVKSISIYRKDKPYMRANLDGAYIDKDRKLTILEIKTSTIQNYAMLQDWGVDDDGNEKIPFNYYCQCLWYLLVTGADRVVLYAHLDIPWGKQPHGETRRAVINKEDVREDMEYIQQHADVFWNTVIQDIEPAVVEREYSF